MELSHVLRQIRRNRRIFLTVKLILIALAICTHVGALYPGIIKAAVILTPVGLFVTFCFFAWPFSPYIICLQLSHLDNAAINLGSASSLLGIDIYIYLYLKPMPDTLYKLYMVYALPIFYIALILPVGCAIGLIISSLIRKFNSP